MGPSPAHRAPPSPVLLHQTNGGISLINPIIGQIKGNPCKLEKLSLRRWIQALETAMQTVHGWVQERMAISLTDPKHP